MMPGCTAEIFVKFIEMLQQRDITTLDGVNELGRTSVDKIRKSPSHHAILLATNDLGRINLYRLVSCSHLKYYNRRPLIPKSEFVRHREGLLLGSACEAGELYQAVLNHRSVRRSQGWSISMIIWRFSRSATMLLCFEATRPMWRQSKIFRRSTARS